jgi:hypothetical protein
MAKTRRPKKAKLDNPDQSKRFIDMARAVGVDESGDAFDKAFKKVLRPKGTFLKTETPKQRNDP